MAKITDLRKAGHTPSLVAALMHFDVSFMVWVLLGALGAYVASDLHLSAGQKGLMVAVPPLGGAAFRLLLGSIVDRVGVKRAGLVSLALTLVPLAWGSMAGGTYVQVLGIGLLLGLAGASFAVALPLAGRWYPPEYQGLALGIAGAGNSGTVIATLAAPRLAQHVGWHGVFALAAIPVALVWVAFALLAREPARPPSTGRSRHALAMFDDPDARWLCAFYLVTFGGFVGLSSYLPIFFVDRFGIAKVSAGGYAALCAVAGSLARPVGGALADRVGGTALLRRVLALIGGLALFLGFTPGFAPTVVALTLTLGMLGVGNGAVFQLVGKRFATNIGAVTGLVGAAGGVGGFLLPFALGSLRGATGSFAGGFVLLATVALLTAAVVTARERVWRATWDVELAA
jgi:NNP family nitrate/nitrite transporter-like MFS transporter